MTRELKQATNQSFNNAFRLIRTETSHIDGQVTLEGYKQASEELGLEYYEYDAFLDSRTSNICRELDKKRFKVSEAEVGVNYPPMHPNCRSTTQLVLDEDYKQKEKPKVLAIKETSNEAKAEFPERLVKYAKKHRDERLIYAGKELGMIENPYFSEKKAQKNLAKIAEKQKVTALADEFLKNNPDYNPHQDFIHKQKELKPYKYGGIVKENYKDKINLLNSINIESQEDNILPNLTKETLIKLNTNDKPILLKSNIKDRNNQRHPDLSPNDKKEVLSALYDNTNTFSDKNKPNYYHLIKETNQTNYVVLLDITEDKKNHEVVHYHKINAKNLEKLINKNKN